MARPRNPKKKRITSTVASGYAEVIGGVWYTRVGGKRLSTFLKDGGGVDAEVRKLLEHRSLEHALARAGYTNGNGNGHEPRSIYNLFDEYEQVTGSAMSPGSRVIYDLMVREYFPRGTNVPLEYEALYRHILERKKATHCEPSTTRQRLIQLRKALRFAVDRGYLEREPISLIGLPPRPRKTDNRIFTHPEVAAIIRHLWPEDPEAALLIRFLSLTAMRIGEVLQLRWEHISHDTIRVEFGKGERRREIPYREIPYVAEVLEELRQVEPRLSTDPRRQHDPGRFVRWRNHSTVRQILLDAQKALGLNDGRTTHTLRATAEHWWKTHLHIPIETVCKMAGHSLAVHMREYAKTPRADELAREIRRGRR